MMLPAKIQSGLPFKSTIVQTINRIIDYLHTQRLVTDNSTIRMIQSTNGITLTAVNNGGGGTSITNNTFNSTGNAVLCCIKNSYGGSSNIASGNGTYIVDAYTNGIDNAPIEARLFFGDYALNTEIPTGSFVVANAIGLNIVQGS